MIAATFNANSIRNRLDVILGWMSENRPDMLCIQETKCQDKDFPADAIREAGYHCAFLGQKTFNGVALISPHELKDVVKGTGDGSLDTEARFISARAGDVLFVNTYIPQGQMKGTPKFETKLRFLDFMYEYFSSLDMDDKIIWCGDFNIALTDMDVYDPDLYRGGVGFCEEEQSRLEKIMSLGLTDTFRKLNPSEEKAYTFWDYRMNCFRANHGWRIDYIMASRPLSACLSASRVDKEPRKREKPSDHTFLISEFDHKLQ